jgi:hypothetical protein
MIVCATVEVGGSSRLHIGTWNWKSNILIQLKLQKNGIPFAVK